MGAKLKSKSSFFESDSFRLFMGKYGIGVTLVPVIVPGVNTDQIGDIIRFAVERSPYVRGVHFQPVSYFGRIPALPKDEDRYTLDELMEAVMTQAGDMVTMENLAPSCCDHPMCGFHGDFVVLPGQRLYALTHYRGTESANEENNCCGADPADKNREFVGRRWERREKSSCCGEEAVLDMTDMESFLKRARSHGFTITSMAFQDAGNLDIERLRQCSLHVYRDGRKIPFCANYLSPMEQ